MALLDGLDGWPAISRVVMVEAGREKQGQLTEQTRFYLSSLEADAQTFNRLVRNHWGIENKLHWMLDVYFAEDRCRTRKGNGADNTATLRKMALQVLNQQKDKESIKSRRKMAGWNDQYLLTMIQNIKF
nr:ISAs1 family transposase [Pontibacter sp. E15-1]